MNVAERLRFGFGSRTPVILQAQAAECALACLAMVAHRYGHRSDLGALRARFDVTMKGMTLAQLVKVAQGLGFATHPIRAELEDLPKLRLPCILHWRFNHFVVLEKLSGTKAVIHDPAQGRRVLPLSALSRDFTGVALELWPTADFEKCDERTALPLWSLFRNVVGLKRAFTHVFLLSLCLEFFIILAPIGFQIIIDQAIVAQDMDLLTVVALGLGLLLLVQTMLTFARAWSILILKTSLNVQWSSGLFDHLVHLPLSFFEKRHTGDIVSRFGSLTRIQSTISTDLIRAVLDGIMIFGICAMMLIFGGALMAVVMITTLIYTAIRLLFYAPYRRATEETIVHRAAQQSHFLETIRGMASLKALDLAERREAAWINRMIEATNASLQTQRLDILFNTANTALFGLDRVVLLWLGATAVMGQSMTLGMLIAFLAYRDQFSRRIVSLITMILRFRMLSVDQDRLADIALTDREEIAVARPSRVPEQLGTVALRNVSFSYGGGSPDVLSGFDLRVEEGESVALVGPSGCGKTTALKLLAGFITPERGEMLIGDVPLRSFGLATYRAMTGCVLQEDRLFAGSIAENISGFAEEIDRDWLAECARAAAIDTEIQQMPMGYETLVGDMGSVFSGGQKQRVFLARALYRKPRILLLDEATSHLDEANERVINQAIANLSMTRICVAHRPSTIALADRVVSLGQVITPARASA